MNASSTEAYSLRSSADIRHALAVGDINQAERSGRHKFLMARVLADIVCEMRQQRMRLWLVNPDPISQGR